MTENENTIGPWFWYLCVGAVVSVVTYSPTGSGFIVQDSLFLWHTDFFSEWPGWMGYVSLAFPLMTATGLVLEKKGWFSQDLSDETKGKTILGIVVVASNVATSFMCLPTTLLLISLPLRLLGCFDSP